MTSSTQKCADFAALHNRASIFILHNPWDVGSTKMLTALGAEALATTSAGYGFSKGLTSAVGLVPREEAMAHAKEIVDATHLPVSADLENGFGDRPEDVAETVEMAIGVGLAGCSIEDATGDPANPIYDKSLAIERIAAGVEAARKLDENFVLCARAENYLYKRPDLDDTLTRLIEFQGVGADCLYAPGLPDLETIQDVCASVSRPVNVVRGIGLKGVTLAELETAGVKRVSAGSALARVAFGAMVEAAWKSYEEGTFEAFDEAASFTALDKLILQADEMRK